MDTSSYIGPITQDILNTCVSEFQKKETKDKVGKYIIGPVMREVNRKMAKYYVFFVALQFIIIMLQIYIVIKNR